jgi:hypothetical protein
MTTRSRIRALRLTAADLWQAVPPALFALAEDLVYLDVHLAEHEDAAAPAAPADGLADLAFLARYLHVAGARSRAVALILLRGGCTLGLVARVFREAFEDVAPEDWPCQDWP